MNKKTIVIILALMVAAAGLILIMSSNKNGGCEAEQEPVSMEALYADSVADAVNAEADEIEELVELTEDSDMVTWNEEENKVLLVSWHKYPESYIPGESFICSYGEVWTFTDKEMLNWYDENSEGVEDWELRMEQLIGLPESKDNTHFSAFWVDIDEVVRPAYEPDVTGQVDPEDLDGSVLGTLEEWFKNNEAGSYLEEDPYPWTRLGYTYDWAADCDDYGLTEFIILADSEIEVEWTMSNEEFLKWLAEN